MLTLFLALFDVTEMYPSIPIQLAISCTEKWLLSKRIPQYETQLLISLIQFVLENNVCKFEKHFVRQKEGLAMGNSLSPILSNIVLNDIESNILSAPEFKFVRFYRYADDCLILYKDPLVLDFLFTKLNNAHPSIKFTIEKEKTIVWFIWI